MNNLISKVMKTFAAVLMAFLLAGNSTAFAQVQIDFGGDLSGRPGDSFSIPVTVDLGSEEIDNFDFEFTFDTDRLNIDANDIEAGPQVTGIFSSNQPDPNRIKVGTFGQNSPITGETVLFTIKGTFGTAGATNSGITFTNINLGNGLATNPSAPVSLSASVSDVAVELPTVNGTVGQSLEAVINTDDLSSLNIASYELWFSYDTSVLSVDGVNTTGTVSSGGNASLNTATSGVAKIGWFSSSNISSNGSDLLNLELTVKKETTGSALSFSKVEFYDGNGQLVAVSGLDGNVVTTANVAPTFTAALPDTTIAEGDTLSFTYMASDDNGDTVTYALDEAPAGATLDASTGAFSFSPSYEAAGTHTITVSANDGTESTSTTATLTVTDTNRAPQFTTTLSDTAVTVGEELSFEYAASDEDGDALTYSLEMAPNGASLSGSTLSYTPTSDQTGDQTITVSVTDGKITSAVTTTATVTVEEELYDVTFTVVMRLNDSFDPASEDVYISGDFAGWAQPGSDSNYKMEQVGSDDNKYRLTVQLAEGSYNYKYFTAPTGSSTWDNGEWAGSPDRSVDVDGAEFVTELFGVKPDETISIADARNKLVDGDPAPIQGMITTPDYGFSINQLFMQDETAGINAVSFSFTANRDGDSPFESGSEIRAMGEMGTFDDQTQIAIEEFEVLSTGNTLPEAVMITAADYTVDSEYQGMRIKLENISLTDESQWPTEKISSGSGVNVEATGNTEMLAGTTYTIYIDRDQSFWDGSAVPNDPYAQTGVMKRDEDLVQIATFFENERGVATSTEEPVSSLPTEFELKNNYPNPFNPTTNISYSVPEASAVNLVVFNTLGQRVSTLVNKQQSAGQYTVTFDAANLTSGVYFVRMTAGSFVSSKKMLLLK